LRPPAGVGCNGSKVPRKKIMRYLSSNKFKAQGCVQAWRQPYPQWRSLLRSSGAAHSTSHAKRITEQEGKAKPSMSACATRGFAHGEKCQAAGRGVDTGGEAEASRMKCSQFICGLGDASQGRNDGYSDRREEAAACQVQLHAAASCRRGHGSCAAFDRKCGVKVHAAKKYAGRGIMLRRPENPASAKTARMIAAASSRAAAGSPAQREDSRRCHCRLRPL
jgi:hypothetical protein